MKKRLLVFLATMAFMFNATISPVNAGFFDDVKKKASEFWMNIEASIPFVPKSPKTVIYKMVKEMDKPHSAVLKMDMSANFKMQESPMEINVLMEAEGMPLNAKKEGENKDAKMMFEGGLKVQGMTISGKMNMITKGEDSYLMLVEAPNLGILDLSSMKGKWYKLPQDKEKIKDKNEKMNEKVEKLLKEEAEKLMDKAKKLPDQKVEGEDAYTISAVITKQDFARIMKRAAELSRDEASTMSFDQMMEGVESMGDITVTLNIYKKNWYFARMAFNTTMQTELPAGGLGGMMGGGLGGDSLMKENVDVDLKLEVIFKNYDMPVKIEAPANFEEFNPAALMGGSATPSGAASASGTLKAPGLNKKLPPGIDKSQLPPGWEKMTQ